MKLRPYLGVSLSNLMLALLLLSVTQLSLAETKTGFITPEKAVYRFAFGSCSKQDQPQPIWKAIQAAKPQLFVYIGDNIYGDTEDMNVLRQKWNQQKKQPGYKALRQTCKVIGTWDDHDYGVNDGGEEYPLKKESQQVFLDFLDEPAHSPRRKQAGVYAAEIYGPPGKRVQFILLDTRYFRSPLIKAETDVETGEGIHGPYAPNPSVEATMLGEAQWEWLEAQLKQPAELRILASSIQVIANEHNWEKWGNFPRERQRLFSLIKSTNANGVVMISGDRHHSEISRMNNITSYPIYDVTSSSLNRPSAIRNEINPHRVGIRYHKENFGMLTIDWEQPDPLVRMQVRTIDGSVMMQVRHKLSELQPE